MNEEYYKEVENWVNQSEILFNSVNQGKFGSVVMYVFKLGQWWADRPWRNKEK